MSIQRLDKALSDVGFASRKEIKTMVKRSQISVNGQIVKQCDLKVDTEKDSVEINGHKIELLRKIVGILNKPAGYVTSTEDPRDPTVMELIPEKYRLMGLVPAGRLDKDTEGLLVFTNDGDLIHKLISPKAKTLKVYFVRHDGIVTEEDIDAFSKGIELKDGTKCLPAELEVIDEHSCYVKINEGKYHQVRRMMASRQLHVEYLKRIKEGDFELGNLPCGEFIEL